MSYQAKILPWWKSHRYNYLPKKLFCWVDFPFTMEVWTQLDNCLKRQSLWLTDTKHNSPFWTLIWDRFITSDDTLAWYYSKSLTGVLFSVCTFASTLIEWLSKLFACFSLITIFLQRISLASDQASLQKTSYFWPMTKNTGLGQGLPCGHYNVWLL